MAATEAAMVVPVASAPVASAPVATAPVAQPRPYLVFFDWDKSELTGDARRVLDQAIQRIRATGQGVHLIGHADASGTDIYNMHLSQRRAEAVKNHLIAHGVARNAVTSEARGERDPLIATADGVREPQNRWVAVDLLTRAPGV
jgi:outer membrane protein OmpA-like peptidoglycan-associated protein